MAGPTEGLLQAPDRQAYEDPFLDMASMRLPKSWRKLQELCQIFAMTHPQIGPVIWRLSEYPITNIVYTGDAEAVRQHKDVLENEISILDCAIEWGLDYNSGGNCFVTVQFPFVRFYRCFQCQGMWPAKDIKYKFDGNKFMAPCPTCKAEKRFDAVDQYIRRAKGIRVVRLEPQLMTLKYNSITGQTFYFYDIPLSTKTAVQRGDRDIIDSTPTSFLKCIIANTKLRVKRVFHFKRPTISGREMQWGLPLVLPALKDAYLNQIYKKADEQIALEHTVPLRIMFPEPGTQDPLAKIALGSFKGFMEQNIRYWRRDKNAILLAPLPVGVKVVGGDTSQYQTVQARQFVVEEILGAMLVTKGFVMGGEQWSAASIHQRTLENSFMNYLRRLDRCLQWVDDEVSAYLKLPTCSVAMKPFKKVDDIQLMQLIIQLAREKKVSWNEVMARMDLDQNVQLDQIERETERYLKIMIQELIGQAEAGAKGAVIQAAATSEAEGVQQMLAQQVQIAQGGGAGAAPDGQLGPGGSPPKQIGPAGAAGGAAASGGTVAPGGAKVTPAFAGGGGNVNPAAALTGGSTAVGDGGDGGVPDVMSATDAKGRGVKPTPVAMDAQIDNWAQELLTMTPEQQRSVLQRMVSTPELGRAVAQRATQLQQEGGVNIDRLMAEAKNPDDVANKLVLMQPQARMQALRAIQQRNPSAGLAVMKALAKANQMMAGMAPSSDVVDMRPQPEQKPPRRETRSV